MPNNLSLNGFYLELSAKSFRLNKFSFPDNKQLRQLRAEHGDWFIHWKEGTVYALPKVELPQTKLGLEATELCSDHLALIAARITDLLPSIFPNYDAFRKRPFSFVAKKYEEEIFHRAAAHIKDAPTILKEFSIRPSFELEAKIVEPRKDETFLGLFLNLSTSWRITASLADLVKAGINLAGLCVVRREQIAGERHLVGEIQSVEGHTVHLAAAFDDLQVIAAEEVFLEGSKQSFSRCLRVLLGSSYDEFESRRQQEEALFLSAPEVDRRLDQFGVFLSKAQNLEISAELKCRIGERISITNTDSYKSITNANPDRYYFDPARSKTADYAWLGIKNHGPFSRDTFPTRSPKILVVFPQIAQGQTETFVRYFRDGINNSGSQSQYPGGFAKLFGLANPTFELCKVPNTDVNASPSSSYRSAIESALGSMETLPQAAIVVLRDEDGALPDHQNPYISSKASLLLAGVPSQEFRISKISVRPQALQFVLQNSSIALYAKMNGTPWTVNQDKTISDELVIGIGSVEVQRSRFRKNKRYVGITTVFQGDGNYLLGHVSKECSYEDYPNEVLGSTEEILADIKQRNGWNPGDNVRIIFHSYKPLKNVEIAEIVKRAAKSVGNEQTIEFAFLTVTLEHPFLLVDKMQRGVTRAGTNNPPRGRYVPERGTIVQVGRYTRLLATNGPRLIKREPSPLPAPLLVHLHKQSTFHDLDYLTEQVLKFTSLSWRSTLPAKKPVSIYYSELIANLLSRLRNVDGWTPAVLNMKLRASRWFL